MFSQKMETVAPQEVLAGEIKRFFASDHISASYHETFTRISVKINNIEPLNWLRQQNQGVKTYWSDREKKFEMAGIGEADVVSGEDLIEYTSVFSTLKKRLSNCDEHLRYYGGIRFKQKQEIEPSWQEFANYRFIVPQFEIYAEGSQTFLACNIFLKPDQTQKNELQLNSILQQLQQINFNPPSDNAFLSLISGRTDLPNQDGWYKNIKAALKSFASGETAKIVLARKSVFEFLEAIDPLTLLLLLKRANSQLYHFCFQPKEGKAFIGGSPERLYYRQERLLLTEAVAGTRRRGTSLAEDQKLADELLNSEKDIREHQFVVHSLRGLLHKLCHSIGQSRNPVVFKLNKVQHLYTPCNGILLDEVTDADILPMLHPTPAVGGYPKEASLSAIDQIEQFERGWYAAPVGWIGYDAAELCVAIRSGLVEDNKLSLFSGAGIVQGSNPEEEWQEIENKIGSFLQIFNGLNLLKISIKPEIIK
jgi:menaquinone-specific isochorismate synthase